MSAPLALQFPQILIQTIKTLLPKTAIFFDPLLRLLHWRRVQFQPMHPAVAMTADQSRFLQHSQMLRNGRQ